eukprot:g11768.t1
MDDNFTSTKASKQQHDDVDVVLLNLGLPLSIVSNAKNLVENDNYRLKSMRVNKNDPTDPFVVEALTDLRRLKSKAVEKEDFIEARRLKSIILQAMKLSKRITTLQNMEKASETSKQIATASDTHLTDVNAIEGIGRRVQAQKEISSVRREEINVLKHQLNALLPNKKLFDTMEGIDDGTIDIHGNKKRSIDDELLEKRTVITYNEDVAATQRRRLDEILVDWIWSVEDSVIHPPELTAIQLKEYDFLAGTFGKYVLQCLLSGHPVLRKLAVQAVDHHLPEMVAQTGTKLMFRATVFLAYVTLSLNFCWEHDPSANYVVDIGTYRAVCHLICTLFAIPLKMQEKSNKLKESTNTIDESQYIDDRDTFDCFLKVEKLTVHIAVICLCPCLIDVLRHDAYNDLDLIESEICTLTLDTLHYISEHPNVGLDVIGRIIVPSIDAIAVSSWICSQLIALKSFIGHYGYRRNTCLVREVILPSLAMCLCHHEPNVRRLAIKTAVVVYAIENDQQATSYMLHSKGVDDSTLNLLQSKFFEEYVIPQNIKSGKDASGVGTDITSQVNNKKKRPMYTKRDRTYHNPAYTYQARHWRDLRYERDDELDDEDDEELLEQSKMRDTKWEQVSNIISKVERKKTEEKMVLAALGATGKKPKRGGNILSGATDADRQAAHARAAAVKAARAKKKNVRRALAAAAVNNAANSFRNKQRMNNMTNNDGANSNPFNKGGGLLKFSSMLKMRSKNVESQDSNNQSRQSTANQSSRESTADSSRIDTTQSEGITRFRGTMEAEIPIESLKKAEEIAQKKKEKREAKKKASEEFRSQFNKGDEDYDNDGMSGKNTGSSNSKTGINYFAKDEYDVEVKGGPLGMKFQPIPGEIGGVQVREISNGGYGDRGGVKVGELLIAVNTDVVDKEPYDNIISKINSYKVGRNSNGEVMMLRFKRK